MWHTGMVFLRKEVVAWFEPKQEVSVCHSVPLLALLSTEPVAGYTIRLQHMASSMLFLRSLSQPQGIAKQW